MTRTPVFKSIGVILGLSAMLANTTAVMAQPAPPSPSAPGPSAPGPSAPGPAAPTQAELIAALRKKVKYVFVIFHENRSFDSYFGTYPGANGLFSAPAGMTPATATPGFVQRYLDTNLNVSTVTPFLMPQAVTDVNGKIVPIYPADTLSVDHSHQGMVNAMNYQSSGIGGRSLNDRYAMDQQGLTTDPSGRIVTASGAAPTRITLAQKQAAEAVMGHLDCDTIPFMWRWAHNFVLYDNFYQGIIGPSTPNAIEIIAGQAGETQWALHNDQGVVTSYANAEFPVARGATYGSTRPGNPAAYVPLVADPPPFPGSNLDHSAIRPPFNFDGKPDNPTRNLTFATQPLSFMGRDIAAITARDPNPLADLLDVQHDIATIASTNPAVHWGWYQQGFNGNDSPDPYTPQNSTTPNPTHDPGLNTGYVMHHNAPQYFGYLADNPTVLETNLHGVRDFFTAIGSHSLPAEGGVFYVRGGYNNNDGLVPLDPTPAIQHAFLGNDDHPAYSDAQISEALAANTINAIVSAGYWDQSAVIITYDETDGLYDHAEPTVRTLFGDGTPLGGGPRIPTIVLSPFAKTGVVSHTYAEHGSVVKFINTIFGLVPLASLPDEQHAREVGMATLHQPNLAPTDDPANELGDLTDAFDYGRLMGATDPVPATEATFTPAQIMTLPHLAGTASPNGVTNGACKAIGILPTDYRSQAAYDAGQPIDPPPADFNPRPSQSPGTPTSGMWTP